MARGTISAATGNAGGVEIVFDGRGLGPVGASGARLVEAMEVAGVVGPLHVDHDLPPDDVEPPDLDRVSRPVPPAR